MSQKEIIKKLLNEYGRVTLAMLFDNGVGYTARNRIAELRREEGYEIEFIRGENPSENTYIYKKNPKREGELK